MIDYFLPFLLVFQLPGQGDVMRSEIDHYKEEVTARSYSKCQKGLHSRNPMFMRLACLLGALEWLACNVIRLMGLTVEDRILFFSELKAHAGYLQC